MCGIAGAIDLTGQRDFPIERLAAMTHALAHRGPDDEHHHLEPGLALGARRLSIIDLEGGRQPIPNEDRSIWVAFNGELFDYPELRRDLLAGGHHLATRCDTEAWVHLYEDRREGMFDAARGQFAVSLWDRRARTLILGRDRVGICPLYYAERDGWLLWGSEIKALLASGLVVAEPDEKGIDHLFTFFCAGTTRTFFKGVKSIPPGHYLRVRDGRVEREMYWDLDFPDAGQERRLADPTPLVDELEDRLRRAVERRLRGDVPVVSYISGGLDSTVVLGLSSRQRGQAVPSFTIGLDNAGPDERTASAEAAAVLGSPLTVVTMDKARIADAYPELTVAAEVPVLDTSCAALMRLARAVHDQGFKVALTGEGADEALAGYVWYKAQAARDRISSITGDWLPRLARSSLYGLIGGGRADRRPPMLAMNGTRPAQQDMYELLSQARSLLYDNAMWDRLDDHDPFDDLDLTNDRMSRWHPLNRSLYVGYKVMLAGLLLSGKGDRVAMNSSVETRYPLLDEAVVDFCSQISPDYKLHGMTDKWMLRQVARRRLPEKIANRPKTMFQASLSRSFIGKQRPAWVDQLLSPESLRATGYFEPEMVAAEVARRRWMPRVTPRQGGMDLSLAMVAATQLWHHTYLGGGLCDLPAWSAPVVSGADLGVSDAADVLASTWANPPVPV
jgi:asparagine synthase (glutamine-hydrolysing)